jgi:hypothetical protein
MKSKSPTGFRAYGHDEDAATPRPGMMAYDGDGGTFGYIVRIEGVHCWLDNNTPVAGPMCRACLTDLLVPAKGSAGDVCVKGGDDDPAEVWERKIFEAYDRIHGGIQTGTVEELRERVLAWMAKQPTAKPYTVPADPAHIVGSDGLHPVPGSQGITASPFYLCREKIRRAIDAVGGVVDEMEAAGVDGVRKLWEQGDEAACDLSDALDNLDRRWCDRASVAAAGGDA